MFAETVLDSCMRAAQGQTDLVIVETVLVVRYEKLFVDLEPRAPSTTKMLRLCYREMGGPVVVRCLSLHAVERVESVAGMVMQELEDCWMYTPSEPLNETIEELQSPYHHGDIVAIALRVLCPCPSLAKVLVELCGRVAKLAGHSLQIGRRHISEVNRVHTYSQRLPQQLPKVFL